MGFKDVPVHTAEPSGGVDVAERPQTQAGGSDHDRFAHYVKTREVTDAAVFGTPIEAICGKRWVPSRDPKKFVVCPDCKAIYDGLPPGKPNRAPNGEGNVL